MILELREVSCGYQKQQPILKNINFSIQHGEVCCLLGPNGVGKSTLFKTILQLIPSLSGQICIDGERMNGWNLKKRSHYMAYVAQAHVPSFPYLVKDMVMMGRLGQIGASPSRYDYEITEQALEDVGIRHLRDKVYTEISGGERQLLMIARALVQQPKILVMDEPTANLDYGNIITVLQYIKKLADQGMCIIFTSHMPDQAFMCNAKTAILFRNQPMVFGSCNQVITEDNLYKAYGARVQILEIIDSQGQPVRVCRPCM